MKMLLHQDSSQANKPVWNGPNTGSLAPEERQRAKKKSSLLFKILMRLLSSTSLAMQALNTRHAQPSNSYCIVFSLLDLLIFPAYSSKFILSTFSLNSQGTNNFGIVTLFQFKTNKTGLQPVPRPEEEILWFSQEFKKVTKILFFVHLCYSLSTEPLRPIIGIAV